MGIVFYVLLAKLLQMDNVAALAVKLYKMEYVQAHVCQINLQIPMDFVIVA